jgi:hypothetical protein
VVARLAQYGHRDQPGERDNQRHHADTGKERSADSFAGVIACRARNVSASARASSRILRFDLDPSTEIDVHLIEASWAASLSSSDRYRSLPCSNRSAAPCGPFMRCLRVDAVVRATPDPATLLVTGMPNDDPLVGVAAQLLDNELGRTTSTRSSRWSPAEVHPPSGGGKYSAGERGPRGDTHRSRRGPAHSRRREGAVWLHRTATERSRRRGRR